MSTVFVLNGANLDRLGTREPEVYGTATLGDLEDLCQAQAKALGLQLVFRQTNNEFELISWLHQAADQKAFVILNAGGWTHTSVAVHDAAKCLTNKWIEVHLSHPDGREPFRRTNFLRPIATASVTGLGVLGYECALKAVANWQQADHNPNQGKE